MRKIENEQIVLYLRKPQKFNEARIARELWPIMISSVITRASLSKDCCGYWIFKIKLTSKWKILVYKNFIFQKPIKSNKGCLGFCRKSWFERNRKIDVSLC